MNSAFTPEELKRFLNNELDEPIEGKKAEEIAEYLKGLSDEQLSQILPDQEFEQLLPVTIPKLIQGTMRKNIKKEVKGRSGWQKPLLMAACLIGLVFGGYVLLQISVKSGNRTPISQDLNRIVVTNNTRSDSYIHLPDGSGVLLKPKASISYQDNYTKNRFVYMEGIARFDVKHDPDKPFTVIANGIGTLDIGTSFWINNNKSKEEVTIKLEEGSIAVKSLENSRPARNIYLTPGQQIKILKRQGNYIVSNTMQGHQLNVLSEDKAGTPVKQVQTNWTNAAFSFSKSPLQKVFEQLSARYQVKITADPGILKDREFTGKIMYGDSLNVLLQTICDLNHLQYTRKGDKVLITSK